MKKFHVGTRRGDRRRGVCSWRKRKSIPPTRSRPATCARRPTFRLPSSRPTPRRPSTRSSSISRCDRSTSARPTSRIGMEYRDEAGQAGRQLGCRARSRQRGLSHHRRLGDARARPGYRQQTASSRHAADRRRVQRTGQQRTDIRNPLTRQPQGRRHGGHSGGHGPLVHEDRRSHLLFHDSHRSRQGHAAQERGAVEGVPEQAGADRPVSSRSAACSASPR